MHRRLRIIVSTVIVILMCFICIKALGKKDNIAAEISSDADTVEEEEQLQIPIGEENIEKENRLNALILERCNSVLPKEKAWMDKAELMITFRSENYLCFEYISHAAIPEDYDYKQLYFTLDLEEERWEEYPVIETKYIDEYNGIFIDGGGTEGI